MFELSILVAIIKTAKGIKTRAKKLIIINGCGLNPAVIIKLILANSGRIVKFNSPPIISTIRYSLIGGWEWVEGNVTVYFN